MNKFIISFILCLIALTFVHSFDTEASSHNSTSLSSSSHYDNSTASDDSLSGCAAYTSCDTCRQDKGCVWCGGSDVCTDGTFYGSKPLSVCGSNFNWMQCKIQGRWAILIVAGAAALVIVVFFICICCCCCCKSKKHKHYHHIQDDETERLVGSRTPVMDKRRSELRAKWGIGEKSNNNGQYSNDSWR